MTLKILGVFVILAIAFISVFYWLTDDRRLTARSDELDHEQLEYAEEIFGPSTVVVQVTMADGAFEPAQLDIPINGTVEFVNEDDRPLVVAQGRDGRPAGGAAFSLAVEPGEEGRQTFQRGGTYDVTSTTDAAMNMTVTVGPDTLNVAAADCARCHGPDGMGGPIPGSTSGRQAPSLRTTRIADRLRVNPLYVNLVIRYGGVVVSGDVNSPMPAWSAEAGGPLTDEQIDALTALVETWAAEAAEAAEGEEAVPNTPEAGAEVYLAAACNACHGNELEGTDIAPSLQTIGSQPIVEELPYPVSQPDKIRSDYAADPRQFLHDWIRDSWTNYNDGETTNMPQFPESQIPEDAMQALITFLLTQTE